MERTAIVTLCQKGFLVSSKIATALNDSRIFVHQDALASELFQRSAAEPFQSVMAITETLFHRFKNLVFVLPTGVAVRAIAPHLQSKLADPAVVVVDVGGRYAISLLCGHEGGANDLALHISNTIFTEPVVTTTTEATKTIIVGVGCRRGALAPSIVAAVQTVLASNHLDVSNVRLLATADIKADEKGLRQAALEMGVPLRLISSHEIRNCSKPFQSSPFVMEKVNLPGVAEPAALLAGRKTSLLIAKQKFTDVTVAVAKEHCTW